MWKGKPQDSQDARLAKPDWEQRLGGRGGREKRSTPFLSRRVEQPQVPECRFGCGESRAVLSKLLSNVRPKEKVHFVKGLVLKRLPKERGSS